MRLREEARNIKMKRVAEIMYIVPEEREAFLKSATSIDVEAQKAMWGCGVRKQQYFELGELIFMTFEYGGKDFPADMARLTAYLKSKNCLIEKRRKDVPESERATTNWWAPVKRIASLLDSKPEFDDEREEELGLMAMLDGCMSKDSGYNDISYDEDDWSCGMHF